MHFFGTTTDGGPAGGDFVLAYADGSTQTIDVRFIDWCQTQNNAGAPLRDRPAEPALTAPRARTTAPCRIYHVPATNPQPARRSCSVTLPSDDHAGQRRRSRPI